MGQKPPEAGCCVPEVQERETNEKASGGGG
jgi:hypothetical protein